MIYSIKMMVHSILNNLRNILWKIKVSIYRRLVYCLSRVKILNSKQTVKRIINTNCSISRYGDGEFGMIFGRESGFQVYDKVLANRLLEIIKSDNACVLVCLPYSLRSTRKMNSSSSAFWDSLFINDGLKISKLLLRGKTYGDAFISRFYMDFKDKSKCRDYFKTVKKIWESKDIFIVEGEKSRLGVGNGIFDNVKSIHRILCPVRDAFSKYDDILLTCIKVIPQDALILCALGMTATVLTYDLSIAGYQALDIGHIDVEYEWMNMGAIHKCAIPSKAVNGINMPEGELMDEEYNKSIIARVL